MYLCLVRFCCCCLLVAALIDERKSVDHDHARFAIGCKGKPHVEVQEAVVLHVWLHDCVLQCICDILFGWYCLLCACILRKLGTTCKCVRAVLLLSK